MLLGMLFMAVFLHNSVFLIAYFVPKTLGATIYQ